jgi:tubulin--tyrosine ligase like protein 10
MQAIIRHVIRASQSKLTRCAGHFGLFGCDFLLDENFRVWLLEVNDNPGVG